MLAALESKLIYNQRSAARECCKIMAIDEKINSYNDILVFSDVDKTRPTTQYTENKLRQITNDSNEVAIFPRAV